MLTGAGCSTPSGIPDYRDARGEWKHKAPMGYRTFVANEGARRRYWARSFVGWEHFRQARPNAAHRSIARLEDEGLVERVVTQNVDGLHQAGGSRRVIDLHGRLDTVRCLDCGAATPRSDFQDALRAKNTTLAATPAPPIAPDGDADVQPSDLETFVVPDCITCGGVMKPDVVFFGESVPAERVTRSYAALDRADVLLVVGSSLMVFSGYRFVRRAAERDLPVIIVNAGTTRADGLAAAKLVGPCETALPAIASALAPDAAKSFGASDSSGA